MKRAARFALSTAGLGAALLALSACGSADDASTEAMPETVEMPADEALEPISEEPVADPDALAPVEGAPVEGAPVEEEPVEGSDPAADVAAEAAAAAEASE